METNQSQGWAYLKSAKASRCLEMLIFTFIFEVDSQATKSGPVSLEHDHVCVLHGGPP
jgi:hypothetical protein